MKILIAIAGSALLLVGCGKYGSKMEAKAACAKWQQEAGTYRLRKEWTNWGTSETYYRTDELGIRNCTYEKETRQYMGSEAQIKKGRALEDSPPRRLVKRFYY